MLNFWGVKLVELMRLLLLGIYFVGMLCLYNLDLAAHRKGYRVNQPFTWEMVGWAPIAPITLSTGVAEVCKVVSFNLVSSRLKKVSSHSHS